MVPRGSRRPAGAQRSQPPVVAVALIRVERHARDARVPHRQVRLHVDVARRGREGPLLGWARVEPQRHVARDDVVRERVDAAVVCEAHTARVPQALGAARQRELGVRLVAVLRRATAFSEQPELGRARLPLSGDELHRAGHRGRPPQRAQGPAGDLDPLHVGERHSLQVMEAAADVDRYAVEQDLGERFFAAAQVQHCRPAGPAPFVDRDPRQERERAGRVRRRLCGEVSAPEQRRGEPDIALGHRHSAGGHEDRRQRIGPGADRVARRGIPSRGLLRAPDDRTEQEREYRSSSLCPVERREYSGGSLERSERHRTVPDTG